MNELTFKRLTKNDETVVFELVDAVLNSMERKDFFIPYSDEEREKMFSETYAYSCGAYDNDKLVALCQIFVDKSSVEEYYDLLNIERSKSICELGGFLVLKEYWGKGIMSELSNELLDLANELQIDYMTATAHPENTASNKILQKVGLQYHSTITTSSGYLRNVWYKNLKESEME